MSSIAQRSAPAPLRLPENSAQMAKAQVRKTDKNAQWLKDGAAMREVQHVFGLTLKEFAAAIGKDERQVERQMAGQERPQIEAVRVVDRFEGPMVIALARRTDGMEVDTVVHIRRSK